MPEKLYRNNKVDIIDVQSGKRVNSLLLTDNAIRSGVSGHLSQDGKYLFIDFGESKTKSKFKYLKRGQMWDTQIGKLLWDTEYVYDLHTSSKLIEFRFLADKKTIVSVAPASKKIADFDGSLEIRDQSNGCEIAELPPYEPLDFKSFRSQPLWQGICFSPDGRYMAASMYADPRYIDCWDLITKKLKWRYTEQNLMGAHNLSFSPDSKFIAAGLDIDSDAHNRYNTKGRLLLLNAETGKIKTVLTEQTPQDKVKQKWLIKKAVIDYRLKINSKNFARGEHLPGDSGQIYEIAFSPDGTKLVARYDDGSIKLWRVPQE